MKSSRTTKSRRLFLRAILAWSALVAAILLATAAAFRMMFPNVTLNRPRQLEFEAGSISQIRRGVVDLRFTSQKVFLVQQGDRVFALVAECPRDACVPVWREADEFFRCPCCGTTFSKDGLILQGPAGRALERAAIRLTTDGMIVVDKSTRLRYEKGDWDEPAASLRWYSSDSTRE